LFLPPPSRSIYFQVKHSSSSSFFLDPFHPIVHIGCCCCTSGNIRFLFDYQIQSGFPRGHKFNCHSWPSVKWDRSSYRCWASLVLSVYWICFFVFLFFSLLIHTVEVIARKFETPMTTTCVCFCCCAPSQSGWSPSCVSIISTDGDVLSVNPPAHAHHTQHEHCLRRH
jgi:hypothetical protein